MESFFYSIFFNDELRPRLLWRLLGFATLWLVISLLAAALLGLLIAPDGLPSGSVELAGYWMSLLSICLAVYLARRWFDKRTFVSLGLALDRRAARDFAAGLVIPAAMMGVVFLVEWAFGWIRIDGVAWQDLSGLDVAGNLMVMIHLFGIIGFQEELMMRGYVLQNLADGLKLFWGVIISSVLFALLHLANPNITGLAVVWLTISGLLFAYAYVVTRRLWLSVGLHIAMNFFEGPVFGFPVSGLSTFSLIRQTPIGPEWLTGGAFGPEAGLILLPALVVGAGLIYWYSSGGHHAMD